MSMPAEHIQAQQNLQQLLQGIGEAPPIPVSGICADSRDIRPGYVFFALQGAASHGLDYLQQAIDAGAAAIVCDRDAHRIDSRDIDIPLIPITGLNLALGEIANRWFHSPSAAMKVAAITGTNGKTTVAWLVAACMRKLQSPCAYVGTLGAGLDTVEFGAGLTTPPCIDLHSLLADFRQGGATAAAIEVSSHALSQNRVAGIHFDAAIFTNLSRDHIDYHGDMHSYGETKARLFLENDLQHRIVCIDTEFGDSLARRCGSNLVTVSVSGRRLEGDQTYLLVSGTELTEAGSRAAIVSSWGDAELDLRLPGDFNVANAAVAIALLSSWGVPLQDACKVMAGVSAPPGRLQRVDRDAGPAIYIDFAHTPAGLHAALGALRPHCRGALWCVFGCGGDRDRGKRPQMGDVAARFADKPLVTSDNPRSENPGAIIAEVLEGMPAGSLAIEDRATAIAYAIRHAADEDMVLISGKGHEEYQLIGDQRLPFSDYLTAQANLAARQSGSAERS